MTILKSDGSRPESDQIEQIAAQWVELQRTSTLSAVQMRRLEQWLDASPIHAAAYADARLTREMLESVAGLPEIVAMRTEALAARPRSLQFPVRRVAGGLAVACALAGLFLWFAPAAREPIVTFIAQRSVTSTKTYSTAIGERATVGLPDGSVATLDTNSAIEITYSSTERAVHLLRGQALFEVAKHHRVPFRVYAAGRRITAVGTKFNVRLIGYGVRLSLLEGVVRFDEPVASVRDAPQLATYMSPGEVLESLEMKTANVRRADMAREVSWKDGQIIFRDESLAEAVAELNRYSTTPLVLDGPIGERYRVTGAFSSSDPDRFADAMVEIFPLREIHRPDGELVLSSRLK
jgi:transmembrane sensor